MQGRNRTMEWARESLVKPPDTPRICPAAQAAPEWLRVGMRGHHDVSRRSGSRAGDGGGIKTRARIPTPHFGQSWCSWLVRVVSESRKSAGRGSRLEERVAS